MKKLAAAMLAALIFSIFTSEVGSFGNDLNEIRDDVLRLHIIANSDSEYDQNLKLMVRDAVLRECSDYFTGAESSEDMAQTALEKSDDICSVARDVLRRNGADYDVNCEIVNMYFDTKVYENVTMPSGNYDAVRITLGNASGRNWWCVMYPPLCIPAASEAPELSEYFSAEGENILTEPQKYEVKFKCVEVFEKLSQLLTEE